LTNCGTADLTIQKITPSGDFAETDTCPRSPSALAAGVGCVISVTFSPTATGARGGLITVDDTFGPPHSVSLSGTGTDFLIAATPSSRAIKAGKSTTYTLTVTPISGFLGSVTLGCTHPPSGTCAVSPPSLSLNGANSSVATVTVKTKA